MANLKMMSMPKKPKLPKKPAQTASLASKQAYIRKVKEAGEKYAARVKAVHEENKHRQKVNDESQKASKIISGISSIEVFATGFKARKTRLPRPGASKKYYGGVSGTKKRKKAAPKKAAKKSSRKR